MKAILTIFGAGALLMAGVASAATTVIYKQDFESGPGEAPIVTGQLVGQDGWTNLINGLPIQVDIGTGNHTGGNLGTLDNMQVLPSVAQTAQNYVYRPLGISLDPTKVYTLTFDADGYDGGFGFGGSNGQYQAAIRYDNPDLAFDTRTLLGVSYPAGYDFIPYPDGHDRASFKIVVNGPASTISAYYNYGNGYQFVSTQNPTAAQIAGLSTLSFYDTGTASNPGFGFDNVLLVQGIAPLPGDFNLDGHVNAADIKAMMGALANLNGYAAANNLSAYDITTLGDINGDGKVTNADLQSFENYLISGGGSTHAVPEPATFALLATGGFLGMRRAWRRSE